MSVIKGRIRGYGKGLGVYLLTKGKNEEVRILEVDGQRLCTDRDLIDLLTDFSLNEKLTRSKQGCYHVSINPPSELALKMDDKEWMRCVNILAKELGFENARRAVVYHKIDNRPHIHIAFERYSHETGKMIPIAHNYRKHDRAREKIEAAFDMKPTPKKNAGRVAMKETLTQLWQQTNDARSFIKLAKEAGYTVAAGYEQGKIVVIDQLPRAFKLVNHLDKIKVGEVRERFKNLRLPKEKDIVAFLNTQQAISNHTNTQKSDTDKIREQLEKLKQKKQSLKPRMR